MDVFIHCNELLPRKITSWIIKALSLEIYITIINLCKPETFPLLAVLC
jgi:hypothetical protein